MSTFNPGSIAIHRGRLIPPPAFGRSTVERPRLYQELDKLLTGASGTRVVSITAPAGSGKTELMSSWVRRLKKSGVMSIAWLTIDETDNDVRVLHAAIAASLAASTGDPDLVRAARELPSPGNVDDRNIGPLLGDVLHAAGALCLVIDDVHLLHDVAALDELTSLLRWAPASVRVAIAGRFEPPLVLTRLRVAGAVVDISADDMDFTAHEARELLARHELDLTADIFEAVMFKTEGWAAGLALAALTAIRSDDPAGVLAGFGGTDRAMSDYLVDEFITSLSAETKRVLIAAAIPNTVTAAQAVFITDSSQALVILEALTRNNFLITRTCIGTETSYSFHPMMRAYLRAEAHRLDSRVCEDIHRRIALWYLEHRLPVAALAHAVESGDIDTVDSVVDSAAIDFVLGDHDPKEIIDLLGQAPADARARTTQRLVIAALHLVQGHLAPATATLEAICHADTAPSTVDDALTAIVRAEIVLRSDTIDAPAMSEVLADLDQLQSPDRIGDNPAINASIALHQAAMDLALGRLAAAESALGEAESHAVAARSPVLEQHCLGTRNILAMFSGRFREVVDTAEATGRLCESHALDINDTMRLTQANAAYAALLRNDAASTSDDVSWSAMARSTVPALAEAARLLLGLTNTAVPKHLVADCLRPRHTADRDPIAPHMRALISPEIQHKFLLAANASDAANYAVYVHRALGASAEQLLLASMIERHEGRRASALTILAPVLDGTCVPVHSLTALWAWLEQTALNADRAAPAAFDALRHALECAAPEGVVRPFTYTHDAVRSVLDRNRGRFGSLEPFADFVFASLKPDTVTTPVRLSHREMELLRELPSFRTAESIAADQFISINTVKTHLRGIYRKLGVSNRRDAITAAQEHGLI